MSYQFRDPIHGMIEVSEKEIKLIEQPAFQRLRYIRQLGTSYLIYHGAEHTRFGHSLGVMHLVSRAMDSLRSRGLLKNINNEEYTRIRQIGRLVGLLHDVGHGPFSHVGESSGLYPKLIDIDGNKKSGHEVYTRLIVKQYFGDLIDQLFAKENITKDDILMFLFGYINDKRYYFVKDLISSQLDADRMDYLLRDSYYCGVQYGKYDLHRLLDTLTVCYTENTKNGSVEHEWQIGVESDGVHAIEEFVFARYWMFIQVYFHKTRRIYDYYLTKFIKDVLQNEYQLKSYPENLDDYLTWADNKVIQLIEKYAKDDNPWAKNLYYRKHIKEVFVSKPHPKEHKKPENDEIEKFAWMIEELKKEYPIEAQPEKYYIDNSITSTSKYLIEIPHFTSSEASEDEGEIQRFAIPVKDKYNQNLIKPIQDYSAPIENISNLKINILRVYAEESLKNQIRNKCQELDRGYEVMLNNEKQKEQTLKEELRELKKKQSERKKSKEKLKGN